MESKIIKEARVETDVHPLIRKRWSPLSFADTPIEEEQMKELFEAASWAASAFNEQPWYYLYALRNSDGFSRLWDCLLPGNQPWTKRAAALFIAFKKNNHSRNGKPNHLAAHDLGMANAHLLLQAVHKNIYGHLMAGFNASKVQELVDWGDEYTPLCMGALGYLGDPRELEGSLQSRELSKRSRHQPEKFSRHL